jgi:hypothetical protein
MRCVYKPLMENLERKRTFGERSRSWGGGGALKCILKIRCGGVYDNQLTLGTVLWARGGGVIAFAKTAINVCVH